MNILARLANLLAIAQQSRLQRIDDAPSHPAHALITTLEDEIRLANDQEIVVRRTAARVLHRDLTEVDPPPGWDEVKKREGVQVESQN
ncbi:MAG: hypothetical protein HQL86_08305 [Magnetococcales bacterium]|nr:hypothetical protein [Magnetococcales bacterium]